MASSNIKIISNPLNEKAMVFKLTGTLDALSAADFLKNVQEHIHQGINQLIFDLSQLTHISSAGIGAFISIQQLSRKEGGDIRLACMDKVIYQVFSLLNFTEVFHIDRDMETSLKAFHL